MHRTSLVLFAYLGPHGEKVNHKQLPKMINYLKMIIYLLPIIPLISFCKIKVVAPKYKVEKVDSLTLNYYYWISLKSKGKTFNLLSEKHIRENDVVGEIIQIGHAYSLNLDRMIDINYDNIIIRIGNRGYYIDGKLIIEKGNYFYRTASLNGMYFIK